MSDKKLKATYQLLALAAVNEIETSTRLICGVDCQRGVQDFEVYADEVTQQLAGLRTAIAGLKAKPKAKPHSDAA